MPFKIKVNSEIIKVDRSLFILFPTKLNNINNALNSVQLNYVSFIHANIDKIQHGLEFRKANILKLFSYT